MADKKQLGQAESRENPGGPELSAAFGSAAGPLPLLHSTQQVSMEIDIRGPD